MEHRARLDRLAENHKLAISQPSRKLANRLDQKGAQMVEVGAFDAKNRLGQLLDRVEAGEEIIITRRGRPVARLAPPHAVSDPGKGQRAAAAIRAMSKGVTLGGEPIKDLISEGRR